jgi:hypothetical protein
VRTFDEYRKRAERAQQAAALARDPQAKRFMEISAQRWRQLAKFVAGTTQVQTSPENIAGDGEETRQKDCAE